MESQSSELAKNTTNHNLYLEGISCFFLDPMVIKVGRLLPYIIIIIVSLVGNTLVMVVVFRKRNMRRAVNFFIVNMSLSDLLITVVYMPRVVAIVLVGYKWMSTEIAGQAICKLVNFIHDTAISVSILSAVSISCERFIAVAWPYKAMTNTTKASRRVITLTWIASAILRLPILLGNKATKVLGKPCCAFFLDNLFGKGSSVLYHKITLITMYAAPLLLMMALYSATIFILKKTKRPGNIQRSISGQASEVNRKVSKMVLAVLVAFSVCWLLYFIMAVLTSYQVYMSCDLLYLRLLCAHFNCAATPVLYAFFSENYRREFKNVLLLCPGVYRIRSTTLTDFSSAGSGVKRAWITENEVRTPHSILNESASYTHIDNHQVRDK